MKQRISIIVRGKSGALYSFTFDADPRYLAEWQADGLDVAEVLYSVPLWVVDLGLTRVWCAAQDAWRWLRLW